MNTTQKQCDKQRTWEEYRDTAAAEQSQPATPAAAETAAFLKLVDPDGWHNLIALPPEGGSPIGRTFPPGAWDEIARFVDEWNGKRNIYFSANEPLPNSRHDKLSKEDIGRVRMLCVDVDPEPDVPFDRARYDLDRDAERMQSAGLPPSIIIDSGGGNQCFWLLRDKLQAAGGGQERAEAQGKALIALHGGDAVQSIEHIMRLVGTTNIPSARKRQSGRGNRVAALLHSNDRRYAIEDFEIGLCQNFGASSPRDNANQFVNDALAAIDLPAARSIIRYDDLSADLRKRFEEASASSARLAGLWAGDERYRGEDPSRSGWRACFAQELARSAANAKFEFGVQDYVELVHVWPVLDNADELEARDFARDWGRFAAPVIDERCRWYEPLPDNDNLAAAEWPEPIDIFGDEDPLELGEPPAGSLPPILEQFARSEARRKGVSLAFAASAALGVVAAAIGGSLRIHVRQKDTGWTEPASLWLALVADPGRAKSPTISEATRPLRDIDSEQYRAWKALHDVWAAADRAHKKKGSAPHPGPEPIMRRTAVDDITFEAQARIHADNPRGLLRTPDELMSFLASFGAYKANGDGDRTQMLRLFDGGAITIDRVGAGSIRAEQALMGIVAGTQPEKIRKITRDLGADGMLQRFLFVLDDGKERRGLDEAPDARAAAGYNAMLRELASTTYLNRAALCMTPEAHEAFKKAAEAIDGLRGHVGMPEAWGGHVHKWGKFLPRIVLTMHCIDQFSLYGQVDPALPIDKMSVERAAKFARFLLRHSLTFYRQNFEPDQADEESRWFAGFLLTHPAVASVDHRVLYDARKSLRGDGNRRTRARILKSLEGAGWLRIAEQGADGPVRCDVNPLVHTRFEARTEWERRDREAKRASIEKSQEARQWLASEETDRTSTKAEAFR